MNSIINQSYRLIMFCKVILKFTKGSLKNQEYAYYQQTCVTVGRQDDCTIVIPETDTSVSRNHCQLTIDPPEVTVRDLESTNGTFLNGILIGRRQKTDGTEEIDIQSPTDFAMKPGDRLGLGKNCEIELIFVVQCAECFSDICQPEHYNEKKEPICDDCYEDFFYASYLPNEISKLKT